MHVFSINALNKDFNSDFLNCNVLIKLSERSNFLVSLTKTDER